MNTFRFEVHGPDDRWHTLNGICPVETAARAYPSLRVRPASRFVLNVRTIVVNNSITVTRLPL